MVGRCAPEYRYDNMARITSSPVTILVQPPPQLGQGSELGSVVGNLWTPGRDASGRVNQISWDLAPVGRWLDVADTRLDALDAAVKSAVPGWQDPSTMRWNGVTDAWNGVAIDEAGCRAWWICAGGHADSANNGVYRFDAFNMAYAIESLPSSTTAWSAGYRTRASTGTYTFCPESAAEAGARTTAGTLNPINDWFYDELFWDRKPTSRHVYSGVVYLPTTQELVMGVRRLWRYSITSGQWTYKRLPSDSQTANMGEENIVHFDQNANQLLMLASGSGGPWGNTFDLTRQAWTGAAPPGTGWTFNAAADYRNGDVVTLFKWPENPIGGSYPSLGHYVSYNIVTRATLASGNVQFAGGLSAGTFKFGQDTGGMVFVPSLNRYWTVLPAQAGGVIWCELDPTTTPWTLRPLVQTGAVPALDGNAIVIRRRMMWMPSLGAVAFLGSANKNISLYKVQ